MTTSIVPRDEKYCLQTIELRNELENGFLVLAERLHKIFEQKLYASKWEDWDSFLEEMKINRTTASKLMRIHQVFVLEYKLPPKKIALMGRELAYDILRVSDNKKDAVEWLEKGADLRVSDVRVALNEKLNGVTQLECRHDFFTLKVCHKCGYKEIIGG